MSEWSRHGKILVLAWAIFTLELVFLRLFSLSLQGVYSILAVSCSLLGIGLGVLRASKQQGAAAPVTIPHEVAGLVACAAAIWLLTRAFPVESSLLSPQSSYIDTFKLFDITHSLTMGLDLPMVALVLAASALCFVAPGQKLAILTLGDASRFSFRYAIDLLGAATAVFGFGCLIELFGAGALACFAIAIAAAVPVHGKLPSVNFCLGIVFLLLCSFFSFFEQRPYFLDSQKLIARSWSSFGLSAIACSNQGQGPRCLTSVNLASPSLYNPVESPIRLIGFELLPPHERRRYADLACGAGRGLRAALDAGFSEAWGADVAADRVDLVKDTFASDIRNPFLDSRVHFVPGDARHFLRENGKFDFINIAEHTYSSSMNIQSLAFSAERLTTVEAFREYFSSLTPNGILFWNAYVGANRHLLFLRRLATLKRAWELDSTEKILDHLQLLRGGDWLAVIFTKSALREADRDNIRRYVEANSSAFNKKSDPLLATAYSILEKGSDEGISPLLAPPFEFDFSPIRDSMSQGYTTLSLGRALWPGVLGKSIGGEIAGGDRLRWNLIGAFGLVLLILCLPLGIAAFKVSATDKPLPPLFLGVAVVAGVSSLALETALSEMLIPHLGTLERSFTCILTPFLIGGALASVLAPRIKGWKFAAFAAPVVGAAALSFVPAEGVLSTDTAIIVSSFYAVAAGFLMSLPLPALALSHHSRYLPQIYMAVFLGNIFGVWAALFLFYLGGGPGMSAGIFVLTCTTLLLAAFPRSSALNTSPP